VTLLCFSISCVIYGKGVIVLSKKVDESAFCKDILFAAGNDFLKPWLKVAFSA